jgi:predicted DNA binding CopG/RHH family protein
MKYLDDFEKDILKSVESGEWKSKNNKEERLKELQSYIKNEKKKALQNSIPYQNLLQMLIHQFVTDKIKLIV